ncbi:MAG TPA: CDP-alcohol phosphatidyltransferase family protein [Bdellovibrionota bacterium]|nr:CDP-alcohol phosphatidyltransferase family protein [Bdellovibrionota bacterium]
MKQDRWTLLHSILCLMLVPIFVAVQDALQFLWLSALGLSLVTLSFFALLIQSREPFWAADRISIARIFLALSVVAVYWLEPSAGWVAFFLATLAAISDLVDGLVARRQGPTARGAKLDMEADAFLMLVLSLCAQRFGGVFPLILVPGVVRYAFVITESMVGKGQPDVPSRPKAKVLCAVSVALLVAAQAPVLPLILRGLLGAVAAGMIVYSFTPDFRALKWN